jgi:hypothetical protein
VSELGVTVAVDGAAQGYSHSPNLKRPRPATLVSAGERAGTPPCRGTRRPPWSDTRVAATPSAEPKRSNKAIPFYQGE